MSSDLILNAHAGEVELLRRFLVFAGDHLVFNAPPGIRTTDEEPEEAARMEALKYLAYYHGFSEGEMHPIEEHRRKLFPIDNRDRTTIAREGKTGTPAEYRDPLAITVSETVPEFEISGIGIQWRLLFPLAAMHTMFAQREVEAFLRDLHSLTGEQLEMVQDFLHSQENIQWQSHQ